MPERSEDGDFDIADVIHAIQEEERISAPLIKILKLPNEERSDALKKLALVIKDQGAPRFLIDALMAMQRSDFAREVLKQLRT